MASSIRPASQDDVPQLVKMLERFHAEWNFSGKLPVDCEYAGKYFQSFIEAENTVTAIAEQGGKTVGAMGVLIIYSPFAGVPVLYKSFWYAKPEFPGAGRELLRFAKGVAIESGAKQFYIGSMHPRVSKLLEREGFKPQEINYVMDF